MDFSMEKPQSLWPFGVLTDRQHVANRLPDPVPLTATKLDGSFVQQLGPCAQAINRSVDSLSVQQASWLDDSVHDRRRPHPHAPHPPLPHPQPIVGYNRLTPTAKCDGYINLQTSAVHHQSTTESGSSPMLSTMQQYSSATNVLAPANLYTNGFIDSTFACSETYGPEDSSSNDGHDHSSYRQPPFASLPEPASTGHAKEAASGRKTNLYKTELCRSWEEKGTCRYTIKCQFAHGPEELRAVPRHPKFKSEICRTFWMLGSCPYGRRCCFIHTTVPTTETFSAANLPWKQDDGAAVQISRLLQRTSLHTAERTEAPRDVTNARYVGQYESAKWSSIRDIWS